MLTQKTAHIGEIHALAIMQIQFDRVADAKVHMGLMLDFVAKNQELGEDNRQLML